MSYEQDIATIANHFVNNNAGTACQLFVRSYKPHELTVFVNLKETFPAEGTE